MTLPTWTEKGGCSIYSGIRTGCAGKSRPNFSAGYKGANAELAILLLELGANPSELDSNFFEYLSNHDYTKIESISKKYPNFKNKFLYHSVYRGNIKIVKYLIANRANVNYLHENYPILVWAYIKNHREVVNILLENGADVNFRYTDWNKPFTPFFRVAHDLYTYNKNENVNFLNLFFRYGVKINKSQEDTEHSTSLIYRLLGTEYNHIIISLLENGLNLNSKGYYNKSILELAIEKKDLKIIRYLHNHGAPVIKLSEEYRNSVFDDAIRSRLILLLFYFLDPVAASL